jgi:hypothetical protein
VHSGNVICRFLSKVKEFLIPVWPSFHSKRIRGFSCFSMYFTARPEFHKLSFWMLCALSSPGKPGNQMGFK